MFDQPQVSFDKLQQPHRRCTLAEASARRQVLWVSDTTTLSFDHPATQGLGPTSAGGSGQGMLHSTLAVDVSGGIDASPMVLGLGHQQVWTRTGGDDAPRPESAKWSAGVEALGKPPSVVLWVHVGDAQSDCWEAIDTCRRQDVGFAVRACQDRQVFAGHDRSDHPWVGEPTTLFKLLAQQPAMGSRKLWVRSRPGRQAGWVNLAVSALAVTLLAPKNWSDKPHRKGKPRPGPIRCWALRIYQINTPAGQQPIEWIILTDQPLEQLDAALGVAFWYSCRWLIEE